MNYRQVACERNITGANFVNGEIAFRWDIPANLQINLNKSYFLIKATIEMGDGSTMTFDKGVTLNYLAPHTLFRQMCYCVNGQVASEISYNYPQVAALKHRMMHKQTWKNQTLKDLEIAEPNFLKRVGLLNKSLTGDAKELYFQPSWTLADKALPSTTITIDYDPLNTYLEIGGNSNWRNIGISGANDIISEPFIARHKPTNAEFLVYKQIIGNPERAGCYPLNPTQPAIIPDDISNWALFFLQGDIVPGEENNQYDMLLKPALGLFDSDAWLGAHNMEIVMHSYPAGSLEKMFFESIGLAANNRDLSAGTGAGNVSISINEFIFYACIRPAQMAQPTNTIVYDDVRLHMHPLITPDISDTQFTVNPKSSHFTIALQDQATENNTLYSSTKLKIRDKLELKLSKYYINYRNTIQPNPYPVINNNLYKQAYYENLMYSAIDIHRDIESLSEWLENGMYLHHRFSHAYDNGTGKLTVVTQFESGTDFGTARPNLLMFEHIPCRLSLNTSGNKITSVTKSW